MLAFRSSIADDFAELYEIDQACFPRGIAYSRRTLRWFLGLPGAECMVAEADGRIIGFILTHAEGGAAQIVTLDVLEAHRRAGAGSALLCEAEKRLAARGVRMVQLETAHDNAAAIAFWTRHGYRTRGVLKNYYLDRIDALAMEKRLAQPRGAGAA
ncbi:MAG: GNAT family N-acetyltransferase [Candidatus Acidiferrales bacterium]